MAGLRFDVPPENQGQIVEVSYALTPDGIIKQTHDRSDGTISYLIAPWTGKLWNWSESVGPWNEVPPVSARSWRKITVTKVEAIDKELDG